MGSSLTCHTMSLSVCFLKLLVVLLLSSLPNLLEELCHFGTKLGNMPLPCNRYLLGGCLSGNIALTCSLFFSQPLLR